MNTVRAARHGDRDLSHPPDFAPGSISYRSDVGRLTGRGAGDAWKAFGTRKRVSIVRSIFRQSRVAVFDGAPPHFRHSESQPDGRPAPVRSGQAPQGVGIKTSAFRQFTCDQYKPGSAGKDRLVPSPRCKRGPFGARGSIPSTSHQLAAKASTRGFGLLAGPRSATPVMGVRFPQSAPNLPHQFLHHQRAASSCGITSLRKLIW